MSVSVKRKTSVKPKDKVLQRISPEQAIKTYASSVLYMKQLTTMGVSIMSYVRKLYPENSFDSADFVGVKVKVLRTGAEFESCDVATSLHDAFDALDKKYLKHLAFCIYEDSSKPESLIDSTVFTYLYNQRDMEISVSNSSTGFAKKFECTAESVRKTTQQLLTNITRMQHQWANLPEDYEIAIRLYYFDEGTPENYSPEGFYMDERCCDERIEAKLAAGMDVGTVTTPFHNVKGTYLNNKQDDVNVFSEVASEVTNEEADNAEPAAYEEADRADSDITDLVPVQANKMGHVNYQPPEEIEVRCACGINSITSNDRATIVCRNIQHAACYGIMPEDAHDIDETYACEVCARENFKTCFDPRYVEWNVQTKVNFAIIRRVISWCLELSTIAPEVIHEDLRMVEPAAYKLIKKLEERQILYLDDEQTEPNMSTNWNINRSVLKRVIGKYFTSKSNQLQLSGMSGCGVVSATRETTDVEHMLTSVTLGSQENNKNNHNINYNLNNPTQPKDDGKIKSHSSKKVMARKRKASIPEDDDSDYEIKRKPAKAKGKGRKKSKTNY